MEPENQSAAISLPPLWTNHMGMIQNKGKQSIKGQTPEALGKDKTNILPLARVINRGKAGARHKDVFPKRFSVGATQ